ncbi:MAG: acetate--CoA ligase [Sporolactobacillus sp.]
MLNSFRLPAEPGTHVLDNIEKMRQSFTWKQAEKQFSWYQTGKINAAYEMIDRHVDAGKGDQIALLYSDPDRDESYTFSDLKFFSNKAANVLKDKANIVKGDRVFIFMPRSPELYILFLGIIKAGAIVGPLFEAFMEDAVRDRLADSEAKVLCTTPELLERVPINDLPHLQHILLVGDKGRNDQLYIDYHQAMSTAKEDFPIEWMKREDGMILHYTSGSTGKPKGVLHVHQAMIQHAQTGKWVLDFKEDDVYWCTADPGWVTGTSYGVFAPWLNGITNVVRGGRFSAEDWYQTIEKNQVTIWYSAPTAFRMLMSAGKTLADCYDFSTLRHVLSVGEPLNPEVIKWGWEAFHRRIHDTWWMTETGGHMICNVPSMEIKAGSMGKPLPGIVAAILDDNGKELPPNTMGNLAIKKGWPSMMHMIWNNKEKYETYFTKEGWYVSGDSAYKDEEGYFWFQGRVDDVIMTSGERIGPFEVESKLVEHPAVSEAGVIGIPDPIRGEIIKAFISLRDGFEATDDLKQEIYHFVKNGLAAHAAPRQIDFKQKLPKTRSGKIMRRVLKAWELNLPTGDLSTLED